VRDRQKPFCQRQPAIEVLLDVGMVDFQVDGLLLDRGRVLVCEQGRIGAHSGRKAGQLARKVEPPARIALHKDDHQRRGDGETTHQSARRVPRSADHLAGFIQKNRVGHRLSRPRDQGQDDGDRNDPDDP
jgi:hypothetical protein